MKYLHLYPKLCAVSGLIVLLTAVPVAAAEQVPTVQLMAAATPSPLLLTEVQTGATAGSDEFIELYNPGEAPLPVGGWQVRYSNAEAVSERSSLAATIAPETVVPGKSHFVLHTPSVTLAAGVPGQEYDATLSNKDKTIGLFAPDTAACQLRVQDAIGWGGNSKGEGQALPGGDDAPKHIFRYYDGTNYIDTDNNLHDAGMAIAATPPENPALAGGATPGAANSQALPADAVAMPGAASGMAPVGMADCTPPTAGGPVTPGTPPTCTPPPPATIQPDKQEPEPDPSPAPILPARNKGLFAPQLSELLPDPAKPQTDANDEFIELYNPNDARFELSGFILEVSGKTSKRYTFPQGTVLDPHAFRAFMSKDTKLALPNTTAQVRLLDPLGNAIGQTEVYHDAKAGQVWLSADNTWQWSLVPTPGALNVVKAPASTKKPAAGSSKKSAATASPKVKTASTTQPEAGKAADAKQATGHADDKHFNPLHPGILALTGVIAVLYGIYEYRTDLANKLHEFRANRAARRSLRQTAKRG